ncbi:MAG: ATP phosphoribosyltransferase [Candidatus Brockarchaeota archaeon]|nr:ATP phosphoribosyltransferase [Candidatus Brockarchaeota archaeon]
MTQLVMSVPNKGRLYEPTMALLVESGVCNGGIDERLLSTDTAIRGLTLMLARAADIPNFVESGAADLGITGLDMVVESGCDVARLLDLEFGATKVVLAAPPGFSARDLKEGARVATELPRTASEYFGRLGLSPRIVSVSGAAEIMPKMKVADAVVDIVSTGATLQMQGLRILDVVATSSAWLIANRSSLEDAEKKESIDLVKTILESTVMGRNKRLVMMNVPQEKLKDVVNAVPAMGGPTVARVESTPPMWEVYSVVDNARIFEVIKAAKLAGARDILVMKIEKVIP